MNNLDKRTQSKQISFVTNPFSLAFEALGRAFKINQNPAIVIIAGTIIIGIVNQVTSWIPDLINMLSDSRQSQSQQIALNLISISISLVIILTGAIVGTIWSGFLSYVGLKNSKFEAVSVLPSLKKGLSKFWTIIGINIMIFLYTFACMLPTLIMLIIGGVLLGADQEGMAAGIFIASAILFIAGLVFAARLSFARALSLYAVFDDNLTVFAAMSRSVALTKGRLIEVWGMMFPGTIIPIIGPLLTSCGLGAHYLQLKVYRDNHVELPKAHILSWLPLFLSVLFILFIIFLAAIFGALIASRY